MDEKLSVSDTLASINALINMLTYSVMQANDKNLRDIFCQARNEVEKLQWETYTIAKSKGYYVPAAPAGQADIEAVKTAVNQ